MASIMGHHGAMSPSHKPGWSGLPPLVEEHPERNVIGIRVLLAAAESNQELLGPMATTPIIE
jgi:hypothetical protein